MVSPKPVIIVLVCLKDCVIGTPIKRGATGQTTRELTDHNFDGGKATKCVL